MSDPTDADRRERAEKWAKHGSLGDDELWATADAIARSSAVGRGLAPTHAIVGYLAGAREEARRAANKLRAATDGTRTWFNERLMKLADEIEEGR